jgi:hypothetical protein
MKTAKEVTQYVESLGGRVKDIRRNKHWVVTAMFGDKSVWVTVSSSPSDRRAMENNRRWILRQVRGDV